MFVGVAKFALYLPGSRSLKSKRQVLRSLKDKMRSKFHTTISEVEDMDLWQKATFGFAIVGNDKIFVESQMAKMFDEISKYDGGNYQLTDSTREIITI